MPCKWKIKYDREVFVGNALVDQLPQGTAEAVGKLDAEIPGGEGDTVLQVFQFLCSWGRTNAKYGPVVSLPEAMNTKQFQCTEISWLMICLVLFRNQATAYEIAVHKVADACLTPAVQHPGINMANNVKCALTDRMLFGVNHYVARIDYTDYDVITGLYGPQEYIELERPDGWIQTGQYRATVGAKTYLFNYRQGTCFPMEYEAVET